MKNNILMVIVAFLWIVAVYKAGQGDYLFTITVLLFVISFIMTDIVATLRERKK